MGQDGGEAEVKRRDFVSMLIGGSTAAILVPKRVFSLPASITTFGSITAGTGYTITSEYFAIPFYSHPHPLSNIRVTPVDLSEEALERLCIDIRKLTDDRGSVFAINPTRIAMWPA